MSGMASAERYGTQIKRARERRHLTQQELADRLGVDRKTVDNWENSRTFPRNRVGALEEWAPELAEDADPGEAELRERLGSLLAAGLIEEGDADELMARYRDRRRRSHGSPPRERAS
jgi:transcriptional regulator with XRE-family HTH domain